MVIVIHPSMARRPAGPAQRVKRPPRSTDTATAVAAPRVEGAVRARLIKIQARPWLQRGASTFSTPAPHAPSSDPARRSASTTPGIASFSSSPLLFSYAQAHATASRVTHKDCPDSLYGTRQVYSQVITYYRGRLYIRLLTNRACLSPFFSRSERVAS